MNQATLEALEQMPTASLTVDLSEWHPDDDPLGFIESCYGMVTFGCNVTVKDAVVSIEGPAPFVEALRERMAGAMGGA